MTIDQYDSKDLYCRMLGHAVPFRYCRLSDTNTPCRKILDCWFETIPIKKFVTGNYSKAEQEKIFTPPPAKMTSILDLINKAKQQKKE